MDELPVDAPRLAEEVEVLIEAKHEAVTVAVAAGLVPGEEVEVPIQAKKDKKQKKAKKEPKKEAKSLSSSGSGSSVELHEMKETKEEHDHKGKEKAKEAEDEHHHHHQQHEELEKEELPETKRMRLKEKVRSLHGSSQAMGVAIKKAIRFTVPSTSSAARVCGVCVRVHMRVWVCVFAV
jgi:ABC-type Zn2+ transport system substrate-binding protein/surface adhesin